MLLFHLTGIFWFLFKKKYKTREYFSRVKITNMIEDELLDSVIEIRDLDFDDIGRSKVIARNFLAEVRCYINCLNKN